jgi:hypothetical protein
MSNLFIKKPARNINIQKRAAVLPIRDVYPGSRILICTHSGSRISDPGSKNSNKREGWKKIVVKSFFVATNITKLKII